MGRPRCLAELPLILRQTVARFRRVEMWRDVLQPIRFRLDAASVRISRVLLESSSPSQAAYSSSNHQRYGLLPSRLSDEQVVNRFDHTPYVLLPVLRLFGYPIRLYLAGYISSALAPDASCPFPNAYPNLYYYTPITTR